MERSLKEKRLFADKLRENPTPPEKIKQLASTKIPKVVSKPRAIKIIKKEKPDA